MENITLLKGDCLELMKDIPTGSVDCIIADLPFGVTRNKWDSVIPFDQLWVQYNRVIKDSGAIVLFGSGLFTVSLIASNRDAWRYNLVWHKTTPTGFLNANRQPLRSHEDICVFYRKQPTYNPQKTTGHVRKVSTAKHKRNSKQTTDYGSYGLKTYDSTERFPTSVLTFSTDKQKGAFHPTQKPVALLEYLIKTYTNPGETVLDNCIGSGSTGVACVNTDRSFIGMELDDGY
ncbi:MAG: site-specific DNA-methyltransferase, partial [Clostridia bacterium]|nr:site-specific DNA-methyltransferase [Clostridia bacterium]